MITETVNKFKKIVGIQPTNQWEENVLTHDPKVMSTIDEGKHLTDIERKQHVWRETKKL